ncbi:phosphotransferase [Thalassotalea euphylliae]|nr:phosphotransferase [Thalassotalea euphylliae]
MNDKQSEHTEYSEQKSNKSLPRFIESVNTELSRLSCFVGKSLEIIKINSGFSQQVFKVSTVEVSVSGKDKDKDKHKRKEKDKCRENKQANCSTSPNTALEPEFYIAKRFSDKTTAQLEAFVQRFLADKALSPKIIYCEGQWLVSEFIDKPLLSQLTLSEEEKITIATSALAKFHRAFNIATDTRNITKLDLVSVLSELVSELKELEVGLAESDQQLISKAVSFAKALQHDVDLFSIQSKASKTKASKVKASKVETSNSMTDCTATNKSHRQLQHSANLVVVHGDLNYTNLLVSQTNKDIDACVIDFESVAMAPVEYDLGMLMAINNVPLSLTSLTVKNYLKSSLKLRKINLEEVTRYAFISSIINWLWFLGQAGDKFNNSCVENYKAMALKQKNYAKMVISAV